MDPPPGRLLPPMVIPPPDAVPPRAAAEFAFAILRLVLEPAFLVLDLSVPGFPAQIEICPVNLSAPYGNLSLLLSHPLGLVEFHPKACS